MEIFFGVVIMIMNGIVKGLSGISRFNENVFNLHNMNLIEAYVLSVFFGDDYFVVVWDQLSDKRNAKKITYMKEELWTIEENPLEPNGYTSILKKTDGSLLAYGLSHCYGLDSNTGKILSCRGLNENERAPC